jgi:hypothetical protein
LAGAVRRLPRLLEQLWTHSPSRHGPQHLAEECLVDVHSVRSAGVRRGSSEHRTGDSQLPRRTMGSEAFELQDRRELHGRDHPGRSLQRHGLHHPRFGPGLLRIWGWPRNPRLLHRGRWSAAPVHLCQRTAERVKDCGNLSSQGGAIPGRQGYALGREREHLLRLDEFGGVRGFLRPAGDVHAGRRRGELYIPYDVHPTSGAEP